MTEARSNDGRCRAFGTLAVRALDVLLVVGWTWSVAVLPHFSQNGRLPDGLPLHASKAGRPPRRASVTRCGDRG